MKDKIAWNSIQKMLLGYTDEEVSLLDDEATKELSRELEEVTKNSLWPSLTRNAIINKRKIEEYLDEIDYLGEE